MNFAELGFVNVAAVSPRAALADPTANAASTVELSQVLANKGVSLAVFPELGLTGYSAEDLFFSDTLLDAAREALRTVCQQPLPMAIVGVPWKLRDGRLLNCAAVLSNGRVMGMVPKSVHPNYGEFYDLRWFSPGADINETVIDPELGQFDIRIDQLFDCHGHLVGVEVCEDLWAPHAPNTNACLAGATIIANLSASNELIAKAGYRRDLVRMASAKNLCTYVYASAGANESTKDVVYGGHCLVAENGHIIAESKRFELTDQYLVATTDTQQLAHDRRQNTTFRNAPRGQPYRVLTCFEQAPELTALARRLVKHPFVPDDEQIIAARAKEVLSIQATGLARRMRAAGVEHLVLGLSGGLDSTLAFLVCLDALARNELPRSCLHTLTLPGPGTSDQTLDNARQLANAAAADLKEIAIHAAVDQHLADLEHDGEHDVVYENAQARERTQILFNYANKVSGIVVGTGDLSELALGWCTYNADHMASYNVNASVPKTMVAYLVRWYAQHRANNQLAPVLDAVLATPISPELIPTVQGEISQETETLIGPYELHDFFLFHFVRFGATPAKIFHLAHAAFSAEYSSDVIAKWLKTFLRRFFAAQFKRTTLPPGPKVGSISLSPRGDWRMPDEASSNTLIAAVDDAAKHV